jgi:flavin reductase (DIM6/NTAB) family NADH-FMN oxidoreductase RutF
MPFDPQAQRRILGRFATGVTVLTTGRDGDRYGMTANAVASLSLEPPLVLVCVDRSAEMHDRVADHGCFAISILTEDQEALSRHFAAKGPKPFDGIPLLTASTGAPILADALAWVDCRLQRSFDGGDHTIYVGEIMSGNQQDGRPLLFYGGRYGRMAE